MSIILKICGAAILCLICSLILSENKVSTFYICSLCSAIILGTVLPSLAAFTGLFESSDPIVNQCFSIMLKALGVGIVVKITSDICSELGKASLSSAVTLAGKIEILLICLPVLNTVLVSIKELAYEAL